MEKKVISFLGGLNKDDNGLNFPEGDYKSAENIIIETDEEGNGVAIKKMNSTKELLINTATHFSESEYVQSCVDLDNSIYVLLKGRYYNGSSFVNAATIVKLTKYYTGTFTVTIVIRNYDYQGCTIEPDMCIVGDRLIWNFMGDGVPMMIQTSLRNSSPTIQDLTLIKAPPIYQLKITEIAGNSLNIFTDNQYQFAARYVYYDGEVSVLGPISPLTSAVEYVDNIKLDLNELQVNPTNAKSVEYYCRDGNNGVWFLIDSAQLNSTTVITFSGIKSVALPTLVSSKQFDSVPFATKNIESVNNLLFLGNNQETLPLGSNTPAEITTTDVAASLFSAGINSINIIDGGFYTSVPSVTLNGGGGSGASLTAVVAVGGSGYTSTPTVTISNGFISTLLPNNTATATAAVSGGVVTSITVNNGGLYSPLITPVITISGGGGSGAAAYAVTTSNASGYKSVSSISVGGAVNSVTINNAGTGYTSPPNITFTSQYGSSYRASASATITDLNSFGTNYAYYKPISSYYTGYVLSGYNSGFDTDLEEETKPFANGSTYEVGYVLFDEYMRTRGVEGIQKFTTTEFGFNKKSISLDKRSDFPSWAKYFQLAITKNLTKDFIYEGYADTCYFIAEPSQGTELSPITAIKTSLYREDEDGTTMSYTVSNTTSSADERGQGNTDRDTVIGTRPGGGSFEVVDEGKTKRRSGGRRAGGGQIGGQDRTGTSTKGVAITVNTNRAAEINKSAVFNPVPFLPKSALKASDIRDKIKYFAVDIAGMFTA